MKVTCKAKTRKGTPCRCKALSNGRCKFHGGLSTGPRTVEGKANAYANLVGYWAQQRIDGPYTHSVATRAKIAATLKRVWRKKKQDAEYAKLKVSLGIRW